MHQNLTAVNAAVAISGAEVNGAKVGSTELSFSPGNVQGGDYNFNIGTAGSIADGVIGIVDSRVGRGSRVVITDGTHNTISPPFHFLQRAFIPLLNRMGVEVELQLSRFGFYPAGGGEITATIKTSTRLVPLPRARF
jgi:RNA 3'-terminal phosphate cyclase (ATP)